MDKSRDGWGFALIAIGVVGTFVLAERRRSLRGPVVARKSDARRRVITNLAMAGITAAVSEAAMAPVVGPLPGLVARRRIGLTQQLPLPAVVRDAVAVVLLDYTLYWWHVLEHRVPWLYRFHQVHHSDLDLDVTTAARFHFGEFLASVPWRAAQVLVIGASPRAFHIWQRLTLLSVLFHHSNVRLPLLVERRLAALLITPRLHGIHHSVVGEEQNSNWSSGLSLWDRLHGTYRANVRQRGIEIGIPAYRRPEEVTLRPSLAMPLRPLPRWRRPDGSIPEREPPSVPPGWLLG